MGDETGRAGALSRGARGGTPRKEKIGAEGTGCGALATGPRNDRPLAKASNTPTYAVEDN